MFYGWQDVLLPLMLSGLVPDDTLFLVCEEDFRFAPDAGNSLVDRTVQETQGQALVNEVQQSNVAADLAREAAWRGAGSFSEGWQSPLCEHGCDGKCIGVCSHRYHASEPQRGAEHSAAPAGRRRQRGAEHSAAHWSSACGAEPLAAHARLEPLFGVGHPLVEAAYLKMREQGVSLCQEPLHHRTHTRDRLRLFWVKEHRKNKGDFRELKKTFADLPLSHKVQNVEKQSLIHI